MAGEAERLTELSARATRGVWGSYASHMRLSEATRRYIGCDADVVAGNVSAQDGDFIVALVNAYRAGRLVPADPPSTADGG